MSCEGLSEFCVFARATWKIISSFFLIPGWGSFDSFVFYLNRSIIVALCSRISPHHLPTALEAEPPRLQLRITFPSTPYKKRVVGKVLLLPRTYVRLSLYLLQTHIASLESSDNSVGVVWGVFCARWFVFIPWPLALVYPKMKEKKGNVLRCLRSLWK